MTKEIIGNMKVEQIIKVKANKKTQSFTIEELKELSKIEANDINAVYENNRFYEHTGVLDIEAYYKRIEKYLNTVIANKREKEEFLPYIDDNRLEVSNFGRVKIGDDILKQADTAPFAGYLYIKDYNELRKYENIKLYNVDTVYQMVAETWHEKPETPENCENKCWDVHHISNDGYDNRPENLIYLKKCQHKFIHPFMKLPECCKNCDNYKKFL